MAFDLTNYSTVADRIDYFTNEHKNFRVASEVFDLTIEGKAVIRVKVSVYKDACDDYPWSVGWAQEVATKAFALESAETSAYGRALANANYAAKLDSPRASVEEMQKLETQATDTWDIPSYKTAEEWGEVDPHAVKPDYKAPICAHGAMIVQGGVSKAGKILPKFRCPELDRERQCPPVWND